MTVDRDPMVVQAELLARAVHFRQLDKAGNPYIEHVKRVALAVSGYGPAYEATAWLHDVVEDTPVGFDILYFMGFPDDVVNAVRGLTRATFFDLAKHSYDNYIRGVAAMGLIALRVKHADLVDHLVIPGCPPTLVPQYERALAQVLEHLKDHE